MGGLADDRDHVWHVETFCEPAGHEVDRVIACRGHKRIGPIDACLFKCGFVGGVAGNCKDVVVLKNFTAPGLILVDANNIVAVFDRLPYKASSYAARPPRL